MRKVIATINTTLDAVCDHTAGIPDDEIHQHYTNLLRHADAILFGRITYQLMEFWRTLVEKPSGEKFQRASSIKISIPGRSGEDPQKQTGDHYCNIYCSRQHKRRHGDMDIQIMNFGGHYRVNRSRSTGQNQQRVQHCRIAKKQCPQ